jgi:hypothetical protein
MKTVERLPVSKLWWLAVAVLPTLALLTIAAGIIRPQPMPVLWDDGHGFTIRLTTNGFVTQRGTSAPVTNAFAGRSYVKYVAFFEQSDATNLAVNILENTTGKTIDWIVDSKSIFGEYSGWFYPSNIVIFQGGSGAAFAQLCYAYGTNNFEFDGYDQSDGLLDDNTLSVEIRFYNP